MHQISLLIFVIDSNDTDRFESAKDELNRFLLVQDMQGKPVLLLANKQDILNARTASQLVTALELPDLQRPWYMLPTCMLNNDGLKDMRKFLGLFFANRVDECRQLPHILYHLSAEDYRYGAEEEAPVMSIPVSEPISPVIVAEELAVHEKRKLQVLRESWLERPLTDLPDTAFLDAIQDGSLDVWDHYTHLRMAWIFISKNGLVNGFAQIEIAIQCFLRLSPRTVTQSFHATMTRYWCHMVAVAFYSLLDSGDTPQFAVFVAALFAAPALQTLELWSGRSYGKYFSAQLMFSADARQEVTCPDLISLPDLSAICSCTELSEEDQAFLRTNNYWRCEARFEAVQSLPL
jgi:ADP-ribosylation factor protein 1